MKIACLLIGLLATAQSASAGGPLISEGVDEGRQCFVVKTNTATYFVDKANGGLTSLLDRDGVDWIGWSKKPGASGEYRGIPNAVYGEGRQHAGFGHPGFDVAGSEAISATAIRTTTADRAWLLLWQFHDDHATVTMEKVPPGEAYWVLYEGIPGGRYDHGRLDETFWGTDKDGRRTDRPLHGKDSSAAGKWSWVYWGHTGVDRTLFMLRGQDDGQNDVMGYMRAKPTPSDGMVVFGFGRGRAGGSQLSKPNTFKLGFVEATEHERISEHIMALSQGSTSKGDR